MNGRLMNNEGGKQAGEDENAPQPFPLKREKTKRQYKRRHFLSAMHGGCKKKEMPNDRRRRR